MTRPAWQRQLDRIDDAFSGNADIERIFWDLDAAVADGFGENFQAKIDEDGMPWAPHSPFTVKKYGPHPLLDLTGRMKRAASSRGDSEHLAERMGETMRFGIKGSVTYAKYHSSKAPRKRLPRRNAIYASDKTLSRCEDIIRKGFKRIMRIR